MRSPIRLPHDQGEALPIYQPHGPREECGVIGIWAPGQPVAQERRHHQHEKDHEADHGQPVAEEAAQEGETRMRQARENNSA